MTDCVLVTNNYMSCNYTYSVSHATVGCA